MKKDWRYFPKYANLDKSEIEVKESEMESLQMIEQLVSFEACNGQGKEPSKDKTEYQTKKNRFRLCI
jgi:hypothetical protein